MNLYVYFATVSVAISACLVGCASGTIAGEQNKFFGDAGIKVADAGSKHDAQEDAPVTQDSGVEDSGIEVPDVTQPETCNPLPLGTGIAECDTCLGTSCCSEDQACGNDQDCDGFIACVDECFPVDGGAPDQECESNCEIDYPNGASELNDLDTCMASACSTPCGT